MSVFSRTVCADVVALDQMVVYNRFGSFNPFGMLYALRRDVVGTDADVELLTADDCDTQRGIESYGGTLSAGRVRLRDCKRPRPITLRANVGDILHIRLDNLLRPLADDAHPAPDLSRDFCGEDDPARYGGLFEQLRDWVSWGDASEERHKEVTCTEETSGEAQDETEIYTPDWPHSRGVNLAIQGLTAFAIEDGEMIEAPDACKGLGAIPTGTAIDCYFMVEREGPLFMASTGAPAGGQGDGGSLVHGLFGAVVAERRESRWYRSQLTRTGFDLVFPPTEAEDAIEVCNSAAALPPVAAQAVAHARDNGAVAPTPLGALDRYATKCIDPVSGRNLPVLDMLVELDNGAHELIHADLNAVIHHPEDPEGNFREFSVFFHDELKTVNTRNFEELGDFAGGQLAGVRNGFAINYGASGMGDLVLANRKGIGPAANCKECFYEEFFLTSWANGDPALLEQFSDDPSNVHHSYLNDRVVFRNFHAGPKETHVFHLHAHQWFAGNDSGRGSYLDSQTVAPQQGFTYDIYGGGLEVYHQGADGAPGWFETLGSGNRNRTVGDSIFHCHLYPHFAQGMWELWRVHDVLEDGTRKLPDGQWEPTLSIAEMNAETRAKKRPGSVDTETGRLITPGEGLDGRNLGTPIPAIVPVPGRPWPVLPTYAEGAAELQTDGSVSGTADAAVPDPETPDALASFPGYPFYIAGRPGHRPPQAPMDIARAVDDDDAVTEAYLDGGLPRHVMTDASERKLPFDLPAEAADRLAEDPAPATLADAQGDPDLAEREALQSQVIAAALGLGDMTLKLDAVTLDLLPYDGTALERSAMAFHHDGAADGVTLDIRRADGTPSAFDPAEGGYTGLAGGVFAVNAAAPKPGAPFADPCGAPHAIGTLRRVAPPDAPDDDAAPAAEETYVWSDGGTDREVFVDAALSTPARDAQVTNWVYYRRAASGGKPQLFIADANGDATPLPVAGEVIEDDPFLKGLGTIPGFGPIAFTPDPAVVGYRRYAASAVQVDMVTNRAGWHDPQARINVLTEVTDDEGNTVANSDGYKDGGGRISPKLTASEEPFFFRALSGECIEFRHTNELPKELELDDFQVKTPTDTIGQHIHLVKFDVTSSDGSGNGFNYEDGTFAPDEIAARICAAKNVPAMEALIDAGRPDGTLAIREAEGLCANTDGTWHVAEEFDHKIWTKKLSQFRHLFQTTTQRWFADPILSNLRLDDPGAGQADRTLRTVFSHDHFGPSSIQQHGFYTALVIEPQNALICDEEEVACTDARETREMVTADAPDVGARKVIVDLLPIEADLPDPDNAAAHREFAVSIADFATLYDPRGSASAAELEATLVSDEDKKGIATLACEALYADDPATMADFCGSDLHEDTSSGSSIWSAPTDDVPPAWLAEGRPGDVPAHRAPLVAGLFSDIEVPQKGAPPLAPADHLMNHLRDYRAKAAGFDPEASELRFARPVAPPDRPESISVDHHDPYLVNYRGQPFPIRVGTSSSASSDCDLQALDHWVGALETGVTEDCEISRQKAGAAGDMANVLVSAEHGDPVVPILNTFDGETLQFRLIQGAQEVQHNFAVEGYTWPRNFDQRFPSMMRPRDTADPAETLDRICFEAIGTLSGLQIARAGRPEEYNRWSSEGLDAFTAGSEAHDFWSDKELQIATCFNVDGRIASQEIGISEHFEFKSAFLYDSNITNFAMFAKGLLRNREGVDARAARRALEERLGRLQEERATILAPRDTPYHFGSQDALWNGAWGLVRVRQAANRIARIDELIDEAEALIGRIPRDGGQLDGETLRRYSDLVDPAITDLLESPAAEPNAPVDLPPALGDTDDDEARDRIQQAATLVPLGAYTDAVSVQRESLGLRERLGASPAPQSGRDDDGEEETSLVAQCDVTAPRVHVAIAAVESERVFPGGPVGTPYSDELRDYDGLFLALVDPRKLIEPEAFESVTEGALDNPAKWQGIPRSRILDLVRATYQRPEPLVVNVKAGDCVRVSLLNALSHTAKDGTPERQDMADRPGDARMPPITSLDVERDWNGDETPGQEPVDVTEIVSSRVKDVRPSARLALTLPLPILTCQSAYGRPYGQNPVVALDGVAAEGDPVLNIRNQFLCGAPAERDVAQIEQFEFYAGLATGRRPPAAVSPAMRLSLLAPALLQIPVAFDPTLSLDRVIGDIDLRPADLDLRLGERLETIEPRRVDAAADAAMEAERRIARAEILGPVLRSFKATGAAPTEIGTLARELERDPGVDPDALAEALEPLRPALDALAESEARAAVIYSALAPLLMEYKPYAFGALPLKSFGDVIGQPAHGLIGAVTVAPEDARISEERVRRVRFDNAACDRVLFDRSGLIARPVIRERTLELLLERPLARVEPRDLSPFGERFGDLVLGPKECRSFVLVPRAIDDPGRRPGPISAATLSVTGPDDAKHTIRQVTLFWQDGLNHRDARSRNSWELRRSVGPIDIGNLRDLLGDIPELAELPVVTPIAPEGPLPDAIVLPEREIGQALADAVAGHSGLDGVIGAIGIESAIGGLENGETGGGAEPAETRDETVVVQPLGDLLGRTDGTEAPQEGLIVVDLEILRERVPDLFERPDLQPLFPWFPDIFVNPTDREDPTLEKIVADCLVCDDSYDFGENGISFRSEPFDIRLRGWQGNGTDIERHYDFNAFEFGAAGDPDDTSASFFRLADNEVPSWPEAPVPVVRAVAGEEMVIHAVHPGGRARQRALATVGQDYDDLFPGFGFPRAALLGPGKALTASFRKPLEAGCYLFFDGPTHLRSGGVWGLIDVIDEETLRGVPLEQYEGSSCRRPER
ncbi:hypothetical protein OCH239_17075 [Roseivivax halodurans JCM 10272]|uniref:Plastocyanin-like domain-containing protein n=1 Tax=Roseivivax halodurans JCM 10272 TaxID=1449350 RepID=X7EC67_9RHOB|nr:hypothetical protein [Roseivivax halodurans]ETX12796.1 hypothetical protein OCH239_17075 [Roseivivax halodurans JCM 10272]